MGVATIITMGVATIASAITQKILISVGRSDEAQYLDLAVKCGLAITALTIFGQVVAKLGKFA
jgi:hypothetical protein